MRLDEHDVQGFRERLADAISRVDALLADPTGWSCVRRWNRVFLATATPRRCSSRSPAPRLRWPTRRPS